MIKVDKTYDEIQTELNELKIAYDSLKSHCVSGMEVLRKAEENARSSEDKFMKAFMTSPDSVNINRLEDGVYESVNEGFVKMLGFSKEEVIGRSSLELNIWAEPENRKQLVHLLQKNGSVESFEALFRHKDGRIVIGLMSASIIDLGGVLHSLNITKDITSRKHVEEALFREQFLVNALMNNISDHVYFKDLECKFIRINKSHADSFGLEDPSEAIGKSDFDFFSDEHASDAYKDEQKIILTGEPIFKTEKLTWDDRPDKWSSSVKLPLRNSEGEVIGTFGISRDITDQKNAEERFYLLANALKGINECVSITDMNDNVLFLNHAFQNLYGFTEDELKNESIGLIRSPNNKKEIVDAILPATLSGGWHGELYNRKKDGTEFLVSLSTAVVKDSNDVPIALIGVASDITDRKRIETENQVIYDITRGITTTSNLDELLKLIHQSLGKVIYAENCFVALHDNKTGLFSFPYFVDKVDTTPEPVAMLKSCTAYVYRTNEPLLLTQQKFDILSSLSEVELVGSNSPSWIGVPLNSPSSTIGVMVLQHYEKENVYSETDLKFLSSVGSQIAIAIERKRTEEEIRLKNELLQALNLEKDKFFSILAHDLRGPLSAFVAATEILADEIKSMSLDEIQEITAAMKNSATSIYGLLENLLEWSRLRRGGMNFIPQQVPLKETAVACTKVLTESATKKNIAIIVSIPDDIVVLADVHMLDSVFRNLVSNAIKFTKWGGNVKIEGARKNNGSVEVKITDSGIGMTPELMNRLFHISEKTSRPGTDGEVSTGLGLLLCKEFIEKHNGDLEVESEVGKGTTFTFWLP